MKKLLLPLLLCLLLAIAVCAEETFVNPVTNGADPFVFKDKDGTYYLYATSGGSYGYRVYTSENLVEWEAKGYCLRRGDVYTDPAIANRTYNESKGTYSTSTVYNFWAPEVLEHNGTYYMAYTAQEHLGIATSDSPLGPFTNDADSYLFPHEILAYEDNYTGVIKSTMKCIDGHFFKDDNGTVYLYFVSCGSFSMNGDSIDHGNNIWGGPFDLETLSFAEGYPKKLIEHDNKNEVEYDGWVNTSTWSFLYPHRFDGSAVAEGPEMLKHNGKYYLTFSQDGYTSTQYSVFYVTADSPLGPWSAKKLAFITADQKQTDTQNPHLYGVGHHCFTTSPDDSELIIVYHAHRNNGDPNNTGSSVEERRVCIDLAGFDESGNFWAGRAKKGFPTATEQVLPSGGKLTQKTYFEGPFASLPSLPTVYVSAKDGLDTNSGARNAPFRTLAAAYAALPNGGTIVLLQLYTMETHFNAPAVNGPIRIKGDFAVPISFKFISINSDTYFDNVVFWPATANNISVIEAKGHNLTMGDGVSCIAQPLLPSFPVLVGGNWRYTGKDSSTAYNAFKYPTDAGAYTDSEYTLRVYSGTWTLVSEQSVRDQTVLKSSAKNGKLLITGDAIVCPAAADAPAVKLTGDGAKITVSPVDFATKFIVYKNGTRLGYTKENTFVDTTYIPGEIAEYTVVSYANGACIGQTASAATTLTSHGDQNEDGVISLADALMLLKGMLNNTTEASLLDVLLLLLYAAK